MLNIPQSMLFYIKSNVFHYYFVHDCVWKQIFGYSLLQTPPDLNPETLRFCNIKALNTVLT